MDSLADAEAVLTRHDRENVSSVDGFEERAQQQLVVLLDRAYELLMQDKVPDRDRLHAEACVRLAAELRQQLEQR